MSAAAVELDVLRAQLQALRQALTDGDDGRAAELTRDHDQQLRLYLAAHGIVARDALLALHTLQQEVLGELRLQRDAAGRAARAGRQSGQAARAYLQAGALR
ncbi:MAG TPA: hypothetical protein VGC74_06175 [Stenotrophomonas sp.]